MGVYTIPRLVYTIPRSTIYIRAGYDYTVGDETTLYKPPYVCKS